MKTIFTLFCDNLSVLCFSFMILLAIALPKLEEAEKVAALVPGLTEKVHDAELTFAGSIARFAALGGLDYVSQR